MNAMFFGVCGRTYVHVPGEDFIIANVQATIAKLSQKPKFKRPSRVIYDDSFHQEAPETNKLD